MTPIHACKIAHAAAIGSYSSLDNGLRTSEANCMLILFWRCCICFLSSYCPFYHLVKIENCFYPVPCFWKCGLGDSPAHQVRRSAPDPGLAQISEGAPRHWVAELVSGGPGAVGALFPTLQKRPLSRRENEAKTKKRPSQERQGDEKGGVLCVPSSTRASVRAATL